MKSILSVLTGQRLACLAALALLLPAAPAQAQRAIIKSDEAVMAVFRPVVARASESTVRILCDDKEAALGTIVGEDGWIITKASELKGKIVVRLKKGGQTYTARIVGIEEKFDLAMLKIPAKGLKVIEWASSKSAEVGHWLAAPGTGELPVSIGVVSVAAREPKMFEMPTPTPKQDSGYMGVALDEEDGAPRIARVEPKSAADKAGIKKGDVVLSVQGKAMPDIERLITTIQKFKAGDVVKMKVRRDKEELDLEMTLGKRPPAAEKSRGDIQNSMGSKLSARRGGFPAIMQTDAVIKDTDCGGPLVGLDGKAVGVAIARAGRTESYAIPSEKVQGLLADLKSGKLRPLDPEPPVVNVLALEANVKQAKAALDKLQVALKVAEGEEDKALVKRLKAEVDAAKKALTEAQKKLDRVRKDETKKEEKKVEKE